MTVDGSAKKSGKPGFYFIVCPDSRLAVERAEELLEKSQPASEKWESHTFWGDEEPAQNFWQILGQGSLFGGHRALLARKANEWPARVWKEISASLGRLSENVFPLFFLENSWEKGKSKLPAHISKARCLEFAEKKGWVWKSEGLTPATVSKYMEKEIKKLNLKFTKDARELFCQSINPDAWVIANELEKLALVAGGSEVTADMIATFSSVDDSQVFNLIKFLQRGDMAAAMDIVKDSDPSSLVFSLSALLAREMKILWRLKNGESVFVPAAILSSKKSLANRLAARNFAEAFAILANAEWNIKSGRLSPGQSLETLVMDMAELFAPKVNARRSGV